MKGLIAIDSSHNVVSLTVGVATVKKTSTVIILLVLLACPTWANMLTDPGFENNAGWTYVGQKNFEPWARHGGATGVVIGVWNSTNGYLYQEVTGATTGVYTFTIWVYRETNTPLDSLDLRLDWLDGGGSPVGQPPSVADYVSLPRDIQWHQIYVSGTCTDSAVSRVRVAITSTWVNAGGDGTTVMYDDAELYSGSYHGSKLVNGSLETPGEWLNSWRAMGWNGTRDLWGDSDGGVLSADWGWNPRSGLEGMILFSDKNLAPFSWNVTGWQNVVPMHGTGIYTFALWINEETNALLSNVWLKIEWYDSTFTNKVNDDALTNLTVLRDWNWNEYYVQSVCTSPLAHEARASVHFEWSYQTLVGDGRVTKVDDARFLTGAYSPMNLTTLDYAYHHEFTNVNLLAMWEKVPGTNVGSFLQVNYAATQTTFYAITADPIQDYAKYPEEDAYIGLRTAYEIYPYTGIWSIQLHQATFVGTAVLTNGQFHNQPPAGSGRTVDVWRYVWNQPRYPDVGETPITTNPVPVYYTWYLAASNGVIAGNPQYMVRYFGLTATNNMRQQFSTDYGGIDHFYIHQQPELISSNLLNGDFESPAGVEGLDNAHWRGWGDPEGANRAYWSKRLGDLGGTFPTWRTNTIRRATLEQSVMTTGGTYTFSIWFQEEQDVHLDTSRLRLEWYDVNHDLVQVDTTNFWVPNDLLMHHIYVTGTCLSNGLLYVKPVLDCNWFIPWGIYPWAGTRVDDAELYEGAYAGVQALVNGGFDLPSANRDWRGTAWSCSDENMTDAAQGMYRNTDWGWRLFPPNAGVTFITFPAGATTETNFFVTLTQCLTPGTGTYTFSTWVYEESNAQVSNFVMRLQWYDNTFTNKIQDDTVTNIVLVPGSWWTRYDVQGSCSSVNLYEVRCVISSLWWRSINDIGSQATKMDDCTFFRGSYPPGDHLIYDWAYHNAGTTNPEVEQVPGTNVGAFLQVSYATTTTTFYVLANAPSVATYHPDETGIVGLRSWWDRPAPDTGAIETWANMTFIGNVEITALGQFHGLPPFGATNVALWKYEMTQPMSTNVPPAPYTNAINVYYAPYIKSTYGGSGMNAMFLVDHAGGASFSNNYTVDPQVFENWYSSIDYLYVNQRMVGDDPDGDGIPDWWEGRYPSVLTPGVSNNVHLDSDGDGCDDLCEYWGDTNPDGPPGSFFQGVSGLTGWGTMDMGVDTTNTRAYRVMSKTNLVDGSGDDWVPYGGMVQTGVNGMVTFTVTNDVLQRFYKATVEVP